MFKIHRGCDAFSLINILCEAPQVWIVQYTLLIALEKEKDDELKSYTTKNAQLATSLLTSCNKLVTNNLISVISRCVNMAYDQPRTQALHCFYRDQWQLINAKRQGC